MLNGKSVLITGGTGSFGRSLVQQILKQYSPKRLIIFSRDEYKQYRMQQTFSEAQYQCLRYFIGDVRDKNRVYRALEGVDYVVHAAALKHVPTAEYNPFETIQTNIIGTQNVIEAAIDRQVKSIVVLSTDKSVNPINLYGATKLCVEKIAVAANSYSGGKTKCSVVRYGNVVGSRGSVIPLFQSLRHTGELPITDERMTRFWITLEKATELTLFAFEHARGGEVFVPKIPTMRIGDLAQAICPECRQNIIGIRPGEKLHEMLISIDEARRTKDQGTFYVVEPEFVYWAYQPWHGKAVPEDFAYTSDNQEQVLEVEELICMLHEVEVERDLL